MTPEPDDCRLFTCLGTMQEASDELIQRLPDDDDATISRSQTEELVACIECLIERGAETGTVLDRPADRRVAQALIDFWVAKGSELTRDHNVKKSRPTWAEVLLKPFARTEIDLAINQGDVILKTLDRDRKALLRRLLFRLLKFPESGDKFDSVPASRQELQKFGDAEQVCILLDRLEAADILNVFNKNGTSMVALKNLALIRQWPWLREQVNERMSFRSKAANWQGSGRHYVTLLNSSLMKRLGSYENLSESEQTFVNALTAVRVVLVSAVVLIAGAGSYFYLWGYPALMARLTSYREELVRNPSTRPAVKAEAIRSLSERKPLTFPGSTLTDLDLTNLRTRFFADFSSANMERVDFRDASLGAASFRSGTLAGINFENANLELAGFDKATIKAAASGKQEGANVMSVQTSFKKANLVRATFDGVIFCGAVDFSNAEVREASFRSANIEGATLKFDGTAWWLAYLSPRLLETLKTQAMPSTVELFPQLEKQLLKLLSDAANLSGSDRQGTLVAQAVLRNEIAWRLAIYGIYSPITVSQALIDANGHIPGGLDHAEIRKEDLTNGVALSRQSIDIVKKLDRFDRARRDLYLASFSDTLAYLLLEQAAHEQDADTKNQELKEALELWKDISLRPTADSIFRYAVTLSARGNQTEARKNIEAAISMKYYPTHELYLLQTFMEPLWGTLQDVLSIAAPKADNTGPCAQNR